MKLLLLSVILITSSILWAQTRPSGDAATLIKMAQTMNVAAKAADADSIYRLFYFPEKDYDRTQLYAYLGAVKAGRCKEWVFEVVHAETDGDYGVALISQQSPDGKREMTPVAMFRAGARWRLLPFDLPKNHVDLGPTAEANYARLLESARQWVLINTDTVDAREPTTQK